MTGVTVRYTTAPPSADPAGVFTTPAGVDDRGRVVRLVLMHPLRWEAAEFRYGAAGHPVLTLGQVRRLAAEGCIFMGGDHADAS